METALSSWKLPGVVLKTAGVFVESARGRCGKDRGGGNSPLLWKRPFWFGNGPPPKKHRGFSGLRHVVASASAKMPCLRNRRICFFFRGRSSLRSVCVCVCALHSCSIVCRWIKSGVHVPSLYLLPWVIMSLSSDFGSLGPYDKSLHVLVCGVQKDLCPDWWVLRLDGLFGGFCGPAVADFWLVFFPDRFPMERVTVFVLCASPLGFCVQRAVAASRSSDFDAAWVSFRNRACGPVIRDTWTVCFGAWVGRVRLCSGRMSHSDKLSRQFLARTCFGNAISDKPLCFNTKQTVFKTDRACFQNRPALSHAGNDIE